MLTDPASADHLERRHCPHSNGARADSPQFSASSTLAALCGGKINAVHGLPCSHALRGARDGHRAVPSHKPGTPHSSPAGTGIEALPFTSLKMPMINGQKMAWYVSSRLFQLSWFISTFVSLPLFLMLHRCGVIPWSLREAGATTQNRGSTLANFLATTARHAYVATVRQNAITSTSGSWSLCGSQAGR